MRDITKPERPIYIYLALGWRKKQPIAYVFGRTMCITAEDIVTNLVKKINDLCGHTYNRYDEKLLDFESDS